MSERRFDEAGHDPAGFGLSAHEWDQLADYVGGALDDTPDAALVTRRITEDPAWTEAYAALTDATEAVRADLSAWGRDETPMPEDVAERLDAALSTGVAGPVGADVGGEDDALRPGPPPRLGDRPRLVVLDGDRDGAAGARPAGRRAVPRWRRWATPIGVAAGILALAGLAVNMLPRVVERTTNGTSAGDSQAGPAFAPQENTGPQPTLLGGRPVGRIIASGTDYRKDTVAGALNAKSQSPRAAGEQPGAKPSPNRQMTDSLTTDPALSRLATPVALSDCLAAVARESPRGMASVQVVDYARYEGKPALILVLVDSDGRTWLWVAGPRCGVAGADSIARQRLP